MDKNEDFRKKFASAVEELKEKEQKAQAKDDKKSIERITDLIGLVFVLIYSMAQYF